MRKQIEQSEKPTKLLNTQERVNFPDTISDDIDEISEPIRNAEYGSPDRPLRIGEIEIPCFVVDGGIRVLHQTGLIQALGMTSGTATAGRQGDRLQKFVSGERLSDYVTHELLKKAQNPIRFRYRNVHMVGYDATILADICDAVLQARSAGKLQKQQLHIAKRCELLMRGFARVGIIALVDEATMYQDHRAKEALAEILSRFISKELSKWAKQFPDEYYRELFRLRGLTYNQFSSKRPIIIGKITKDIVYDRLAPGVTQALDSKNPVVSHGRRKHKHFQWLTPEVGQEKLREHLHALVVLMRASSNWAMFNRLLERSLPRCNVQIPLPGMESAGQTDD